MGRDAKSPPRRVFLILALVARVSRRKSSFPWMVLRLAISWATNVRMVVCALTSDSEADESVADTLWVVGMSKNFQIPRAGRTQCGRQRLLPLDPAFMEAPAGTQSR